MKEIAEINQKFTCKKLKISYNKNRTNVLYINNAENRNFPLTGKIFTGRFQWK